MAVHLKKKRKKKNHNQPQTLESEGKKTKQNMEKLEKKHFPYYFAEKMKNIWV